MSKDFFKAVANIVFVTHLFVIFVVLFGWYFPSLTILYGSLLIATLLLDLWLGYCVLTRLEDSLRKKISSLKKKRNEFFISYYLKKIFGKEFTNENIRLVTRTFIAVSLMIYML